MLSCKKIAEKASDYIDNELDIKTKVEFMIHKMICPTCRRFLNYFEIIYSTKRHFKRQIATDQEVDEIMDFIKKRKIEKKQEV